MDEAPKSSTRNVRAKCLRFTLDAINVLHLIIACLTIIGAIAVKALFRQYQFVTTFSTLKHLPNLWIATGFFLAVVSVFGIYATIKKSTKLINLYAAALTFVFVLQMATAITGFALLPQSFNIAQDSLRYLMGGYKLNYQYRYTMDWIQQTFRCCGIAGPDDWSYTPQSCCSYTVPGDLVCEPDSFYGNFFYVGCRYSVYDVAYRSILLIAWSAVVIGLFQIWGVISAFVLAKRVRQSKTERDIKRWTSANDVLKESLPEKIK